MRIGLLAPPWIPVPPPGYGGTELIVGLLAGELAEAGCQVVMVAHPGSMVPGVDVIAAPAVPPGVGIGQVSVELAHVLWAYRRLLEAGVDIIHDHTSAGPAVGASLARESGVPVVATNHGPFDWRAREILGRSGCAVVAVSHNQARGAGELPVAAVIHHGLEVRDVPIGNGAGGYVAFLGRFSKDKGVDRACAIAREAGLPLRIAAKMWEPDEIEYFDREIKPLVGTGVDYVGELGGRDKYEFLGQAVALLNPIDWEEPFGLNMIEALACGTPVVATARGAAPEIVEHGRTGFIGAADELTSALLDACDLDRAERRRAAMECFSSTRLAADHMALYRRLAPPAALAEVVSL